MISLTTADVRDVTGLPASTLRVWVDRGAVTPADAGGRGRGNARTFPLMTAVGLGVAARLHQSDRRCALSFVERVIAAFAGETEEWLRRAIEAGNTHFMTLHHGRPLLRGPASYWVDVEEVYDRVLARAGRVERVGK